ncbi:MAG: hypothetical protein NVSMB5_18800 [Candidatus Velthaea sp.]
MSAKVKALILSGGGARGAYEAGVVTALAETESFDIVCGTSIGALNGMLVAQGLAPDLPEIWGQIATQNVAQFKPEVAALVRLCHELRAIIDAPFAKKAHHLATVVTALPELRLAHQVAEMLGFYDSRAVRDFVTKHGDLSKMSKTFVLGVTNLSTARGTAFAFFPAGAAGSHEDFFFREHDAEAITADNLVDAICASAALPPAFEPIEIACADGTKRFFADGFATNNTPFRQAIDAGATEITAIFVEPLLPDTEPHEVRTLAHVATLMLEANGSRMLELDLKLARRINDAVRAGAAPGKRYVDIRVIGPDTPLRLPPLDFNNRTVISDLVKRGQQDGARYRVPQT